MADESQIQRITRLTPLAMVLALIESSVGAVKPLRCELGGALNRTLAEDVVAGPIPPIAIALRDGYAVDAAAIADAGPYAPVALPQTARRVDVGQRLPNGCDAVVPVDAIALRDGRAEAVAAVGPGEGVLPAGGDVAPRTRLRRAGERLRTVDIAVLRAAGIEGVKIRAPCVSVVHDGKPTSRAVESAREMLLRAVVESGGDVFDEVTTLSGSFAYTQPDAIISVGGTGIGQRDNSVQELAKLGTVEAHGIAVSPGETAAFGFDNLRPVLLVPGRIDAALAVWLLVGRYLAAKLAGGRIEDAPVMLPLKRKVTSTIGLTELIPVRCAGGVAEPLASGYLSFAALAGSDGWIVVPADSEGFNAGTPVAVRSWP